MNVFVDENIPLITVTALQALGHDVRDIRGTSREGSDDEVVWQMVQAERRLLVTTDRGFAARRAEIHHGVLIVVLRHPNAAKIHERVLRKRWPSSRRMNGPACSSFCGTQCEAYGVPRPATAITPFDVVFALRRILTVRPFTRKRDA